MLIERRMRWKSSTARMVQLFKDWQIDQEMFLHSDMLKQCHWIVPGYNCIFRWEQLALRDNGVKILMFLNQSTINKPEFDLAQIGLKYFRKLFC